MQAVRILTAACLTLAAASCGSGEGGAAPIPAPSSLTGVIVGIDAEALGDVTSFELRADGTDYTLYIEEDRDYGFPLGHLNEHFQMSLPVRVELDEINGKLYALSIEDA